MSIRTVLRHRATVKRQAGTSWATVASDMPCLLSVALDEPQPALSQEQQRFLDRTGTLFALPDADLLPNDRIVMTRGASGSFVVRPDPATVSTLSGPHHREHRVSEVP